MRELFCPIRIYKLHAEIQITQVCQKDKLNKLCIEFYVETLKWEKPREQIFTIDSGYTTQRGLQHSYEWISHAGLFASAVTHTAMARLTLLSLTLSQSTHILLLLFSHVLKVCPSCIYTYTTFWLFTYLALMGRTFRLFTNIVSRVGYIHDSCFSSTQLLDCRLSEQSDLPPTGGTNSQHELGPSSSPLH